VDARTGFCDHLVTLVAISLNGVCSGPA
jgi:hypothetical protein